MNEQIAAWRAEWGTPEEPQEQVEALAALYRILFGYNGSTQSLMEIWSKSGFHRAANTLLYVHSVKDRKRKPMVLCLMFTRRMVAKEKEAQAAELRKNVDAMQRQLDVLEQMAIRDPSFREEADVLRNKVHTILCPTKRTTRATKKPS